MSLAKVAIVCGLATLALAGCGIQTKPLAGTNLKQSKDYYGVVDDPLTPHTNCLRADHVKFRVYLSGKQRLPAIQVGTLPSGPTIIFYPTPGIAQGLQIMGEEQGAEVIGSALLYPNKASNAELQTVETCTAIGVSG
ncbi:MAG: hypothetical protein ACP5H2_06460 [Solirubrobacteraceae bacterium]